MLGKKITSLAVAFTLILTSSSHIYAVSVNTHISCELNTVTNSTPDKSELEGTDDIKDLVEKLNAEDLKAKSNAKNLIAKLNEKDLEYLQSELTKMHIEKISSFVKRLFSLKNLIKGGVLITIFSMLVTGYYSFHRFSCPWYLDSLDDYGRAIFDFLYKITP